MLLNSELNLPNDIVIWKKKKYQKRLQEASIIKKIKKKIREKALIRMHIKFNKINKIL